MKIQCMRWEIGCEADYDNVLDFRQLHKSRDHKMSKWPVNHDVCCSPFSQGWPLWQAFTANKKGAVSRNKSAQTSCSCLYSEATFVPVVWPSSPLQGLCMTHRFVDVLWWHNLVCFSYICTSSSEGNSNDGNNNTSDGNNNNNNCEGNSNREWQYSAHVGSGQVECWGRIPPLSDSWYCFIKIKPLKENSPLNQINY